jgi:hypothetical protein
MVQENRGEKMDKIVATESPEDTIREAQSSDEFRALTERLSMLKKHLSNFEKQKEPLSYDKAMHIVDLTSRISATLKADLQEEDLKEDSLLLLKRTHILYGQVLDVLFNSLG